MLIQIAHVAIIAVCLVLSVPYGRFMAKVFNGERNLLTPIMRPIERAIYCLCGINENEEM